MAIVEQITPIAITPATQSKSGLMSDSDKRKLDGIDVATDESYGLVKPDNDTIRIQDGVIEATANMVWNEITE